MLRSWTKGCTCLSHAAFLELGFASPAGQTYVSAADLGKFMALIFKLRQDRYYNVYNIINTTCIIIQYKLPSHTHACTFLDCQWWDYSWMVGPSLQVPRSHWLWLSMGAYSNRKWLHVRSTHQEWWHTWLHSRFSDVCKCMHMMAFLPLTVHAS